MLRLEVEYKELSDRILTAGEVVQRMVIIEACKYAVEKSELQESIVQDIIEAFIRKGEPDSSLKQEIQDLMDKYDNEYFDMQEEDDDDWIFPFNKARACSALIFLFDIADIGEAATEVVYEATALGDENDLFDILENIFK